MGKWAGQIAETLGHVRGVSGPSGESVGSFGEKLSGKLGLTRFSANLVLHEKISAADKTSVLPRVRGVSLPSDMMIDSNGDEL